MADIDIRVSGRAGRITLTRERALNALSSQSFSKAPCNSTLLLMRAPSIFTLPLVSNREWEVADSSNLPPMCA